MLIKIIRSLSTTAKNRGKGKYFQPRAAFSCINQEYVLQFREREQERGIERKSFSSLS